RTWCFLLVAANVFRSVARTVQRGAIGRWNDPPVSAARMRNAVRTSGAQACRAWWPHAYTAPVAYTATTLSAADGHRSQAGSSEVTVGDWPNSVSARRGGTESGVAAGTWGWVVVLISRQWARRGPGRTIRSRSRARPHHGARSPRPRRGRSPRPQRCPRSRTAPPRPRRDRSPRHGPHVPGHRSSTR